MIAASLCFIPIELQISSALFLFLLQPPFVLFILFKLIIVKTYNCNHLLESNDCSLPTPVHPMIAAFLLYFIVCCSHKLWPHDDFAVMFTDMTADSLSSQLRYYCSLPLRRIRKIWEWDVRVPAPRVSGRFPTQKVLHEPYIYYSKIHCPQIFILQIRVHFYVTYLVRLESGNVSGSILVEIITVENISNYSK